jgi:hypothetical protein
MKMMLAKKWVQAVTVIGAIVTGAAYGADWEPARTTSGRPDLQGIWNNTTRTPLERSASLGEQKIYSIAEAQATEARLLASLVAADAPLDPDRGAPTQDDTGTYDTFWIELGTSITQINGDYRTSLIIDPENGRIPWLSEEERAHNLLAQWLARPGVGPFDGPELQTIGERCLLFFDFRTSNSSSGPPMMPMYYNSNYQIVQTDDYIVITAEMMHDARIIPIDSEHQSEVLKKWMGDSVGHWEGDTLVVTTRNFHPQQSHFGGSPERVVTEYLTPIAEGKIRYRFTIEDPLVYSALWTAEMVWSARPNDEKIYEYACHEGNYALSGILGGARYKEKTQ